MQHDFGHFEEEKLGKIREGNLWSRVFDLIGPQWLWISVAILLAMLSVGASLTLPNLMRMAIDRYVVNPEPAIAARIDGLGLISLLFLGISLFAFLTNFLQSIALEWVGQQTMHRLRQDLFKKLLHLDLAFFNNNPGGKLVTRLTNDIENMQEMFSSVIVTIFNDSLRMLAILVVLYFMNLRLAAILTLLTPFIITNIYWSSKLSRKVSRLVRTCTARINSYLQESISGLAIIQLLRREPATINGFASLNDDFLQLSKQQIRILAIFNPMVEMFSSIAIAIIIWYGGGEIISQRMSLGNLVAFLAYMRLFFQPVRELSQKYSIVQSALASSERIFQLMDTKSKLPLVESPIMPQEISGTVKFENVSFGYQPDQQILHDFNLTINAGETVAFVGATGSGKTTIINLLERFYDPAQGRITIDDIDIRDLDYHWLRTQIGLVMQDVLIVPGSIRDNILLDLKLDDAEIKRILKDGQIEEFLQRLPDGLDTVIGDGGSSLSAGQNQLLALARILARNPRILVLDEATANIDSATEILIEQAIAATISNRTSIIIAHRLSTIRRADRIIVFDRGRLVEQGNHDQLMANSVYYRRMQQQARTDKIST